MSRRLNFAAVFRLKRALSLAAVLILLAVLGYRWKPGGTWSESEAVRTVARVSDVEWLDDATFPRLMCMRKTWQYQDHSGERHSFTTMGSWMQKPTLKEIGAPDDGPWPDDRAYYEAGLYVRTELLDPDDTWAWTEAGGWPVSLQKMVDFEQHAWTDTLKIKHLIDEPEQWRDAAKDDNGDYLNKPAWLSFVVVGVPGFLALCVLAHVVMKLFPGRMERRRRYQRGS